MKTLLITLGAASMLLLPCCTKTGQEELPGLKTVKFEFSDTQIPNPERGLYSGASFESEDEEPISSDEIKALRSRNITLFMLEFWLKDFFESDISQGYLNLIRSNLGELRSGGSKCILRFGYSDSIDDLDKPQDGGPYDASEEQVLRHIAQLKPILQEYADVIYVLQAGFVGCWGEWYYTDHFIQDPQSDEDYLPRRHVCDALLDALPSTRQVELRTPLFKMKMYGYSLADSLTRAQAHQPTAKARLAGHNDCYLASSSDQGTFNNSKERDYWKAETQYTIMGGETCELSSYCRCENTLQSMIDYHFSYLNINYNKKVLNQWSQEGCYDEIAARLGYRLFLTEASFTAKPRAGENFRAVLNICNDGFASVMNPRDAQLVLTNKSGKVIQRYTIESDPRFWMPGTTTRIDQTITLPEDLSGEYTICLALPDPCETLRSSALFSIALSNKDIWDKTRGLNKLYSFKL